MDKINSDLEKSNFADFQQINFNEISNKYSYKDEFFAHFKKSTIKIDNKMKKEYEQFYAEKISNEKILK